MRVFRILMPVPDIEAAAKFYSALFQHAGERVSPGRHYFKAGDIVFACYSPNADGDGAKPHPLETETYLAVQDVEATLDRALAAGAKLSTTDNAFHGHLGRIAKRPWGERSVYVADPFGNALCFVDEKTLFLGRTANR